MIYKCSNCSKVGSFRCSKCKMAYYCSRECQMACHNDHKSTLCKGVTSSLRLIKKEERELRREMPGIFGDDEDAEYSEVGSFWGVFETRAYMKAKHNFFLYLDKVGTTPALEEALCVGRDMLRLCRGDNLGVRSLLPAMYLSLRANDRMQECYDFVKWWMTCDPSGTYDWGNPTLPYLNISGADMCEPVLKEALGKYGDVYECVALTIIKIVLHHKLLTSFCQIDAFLGATIFATGSPIQHLRGHEMILVTVADYLRPDCPCFANLSFAELRRLETALSEQVETLMGAVESRNPRIWKALVNPEKVKRAPIPYGVSLGSAEEAICLVLSYMKVLNQNCEEGRVIRKRLVDRVGEAPDYDLTPLR